MTTALPVHGYIGCRSCFPGAEHVMRFANSDGSRWQIEQPNAAWGSTEPEVLVLGFSRGATQSKPGTPFDDIAFKGMRGSLTLILRALGLLGTESVDTHIRASETRFGFGSLVRCSVAQWDEAKAEYSKSGGAILKKFAKGDITQSIASRCSATFLGSLPERTKLVVMLSNDPAYIDFCFHLMRAVRGDAARVNAVAYDSAGVRFVHTIHAKAQGALVPDWLEKRNSQTGRYR